MKWLISVHNVSKFTLVSEGLCSRGGHTWQPRSRLRHWRNGWPVRSGCDPGQWRPTSAEQHPAIRVRQAAKSAGTGLAGQSALSAPGTARAKRARRSGPRKRSETL